MNSFDLFQNLPILNVDDASRSWLIWLIIIFFTLKLRRREIINPIFFLFVVGECNVENCVSSQIISSYGVSTLSAVRLECFWSRKSSSSSLGCLELFWKFLIDSNPPEVGTRACFYWNSVVHQGISVEFPSQKLPVLHMSVLWFLFKLKILKEIFIGFRSV